MFYLLSATAMSLGWGLRGTIGGGPYGAMIPGAIIALCLCLFLGIRSNVLFIAAMGAIGVGLGGQMTYGQTIGFISDPNTFWWGLAGLTLKGAAWGLLGGLILGMGFVVRKYQRWEVLTCLFLMVAGTFIGWALVDHPKLIYFSNRIDKPREELLIGMYLGALGFAILPILRKREIFTLEMGLLGLLFGGLGFGGGGLFMSISKTVPAAYRQLPFWKGMEFTFGAMLGLGFAIACFRNRKWLRIEDDAAQTSNATQIDAVSRRPEWLQYALATAVVLGSLYWQFGITRQFPTRVPLQGMYTIVGAVLLAMALYSEFLAGHIALSLTVAAFFRDFLMEALKMKSGEEPLIDANAQWSLVLLMILPIVGFVTTQLVSSQTRTARLLLLMCWIGTLDCYIKLFGLFKFKGTFESSLVPLVFAVELVVITFLVVRATKGPTQAAVV